MLKSFDECEAVDAGLSRDRTSCVRRRPFALGEATHRYDADRLYEDLALHHAFALGGGGGLLQDVANDIHSFGDMAEHRKTEIVPRLLRIGIHRGYRADGDEEAGVSRARRV